MTEPAPVLTLVTGTEDLLADRAVRHVVATATHADPTVEVHVVEPGAEPGAVRGAASPSLFGTGQVIVVRRAHELSAELSAELVELIEASVEGVTVVVTHSGAANRGKAVLTAARAAKAHEVSAAPLKRIKDRLAFVAAEFRHARRAVDPDAVEALLEAVGDDVRELATACSQLVADTDGPVDLAAVRRYYAGRADVTAYAVADRAVEGRTADAVELVRHALAGGVSPVVITSALASQLRSMVRVATAPRGLSAADVARHAGVPPWKVDVLRRQLRGWDGDRIAVAIALAATADAEAKGAGGSPDYAAERLVAAVATAREG